MISKQFKFIQIENKIPLFKNSKYFIDIKVFSILKMSQYLTYFMLLYVIKIKKIHYIL